MRVYIHMYVRMYTHTCKHYTHTSLTCVLHAIMYCRNNILEKDDAARMVEKVVVKWPQLEDKLAHIQVQTRSVENREAGSARGRREKALAEELARAKTSGEDVFLATNLVNVFHPIVTQSINA